jgi:hypothetical protein
MASISADSNNANVPAVQSENTAGGDGVFATGRRGVVGVSNDFQGVFGESSASSTTMVACTSLVPSSLSFSTIKICRLSDISHFPRKTCFAINGSRWAILTRQAHATLLKH